MKTATVISKDGTSIVYDVQGEGPALVYITGAICFRKFGPLVKDAKEFAKDYRVYTYDRRGRGDSGDNKPYSVEKEIQDLEAVIDAAGGAAFLYGHSSGAVIALEAAMQIPRKVRQVFIYDAAYSSGADEIAKFAPFKQKTMQALADGKYPKALRTFLTGIGMPKLFVYLISLMPGWGTMKKLAPTLEYDMILTGVTAPVDRIAQITVPVRIVYGQKSPPILHKTAKQIHEALPKAAFIEVPGQDHMVSPQVLRPYLAVMSKGN